MYKIRFHLARGKNFMHWQIKDKENNTQYIDPEKHQLIIIAAQLKNRTSTASKIFNGENKTVCAWIECSYFQIFEKEITKSFKEIFYNPRKNIHWNDENKKNIDNEKYKIIISEGKKLFALKEENLK